MRRERVGGLAGLAEALESALQHRAAASLSSRWLKASSSYRCFSSSSSAASSLCARISSFVCCSACNRASRTCGRRAERTLRCAAYRQSSPRSDGCWREKQCKAGAFDDGRAAARMDLWRCKCMACAPASAASRASRAPRAAAFPSAGARGSPRVAGARFSAAPRS